jgi:hypothetical protein
MNLHLAEIDAEVKPGAHAVLLLDQAGWHMSSRLIVPPNITLVPLPPKCPELNPTENIWQTVCSLPTWRSLAQASRIGWPEAGLQPRAGGPIVDKDSSAFVGLDFSGFGRGRPSGRNPLLWRHRKHA